MTDLAALRAVCGAVSKPVNFMAGIAGRSFPVADAGAAGARRISLATSLYRAAMTGMVAAATEAMENGTFAYVDRAMSTPEVARFMRQTERK